MLFSLQIALLWTFEQVNNRSRCQLYSNCPCQSCELIEMVRLSMDPKCDRDISAFADGIEPVFKWYIPQCFLTCYRRISLSVGLFLGSHEVGMGSADAGLNGLALLTAIFLISITYSVAAPSRLITLSLGNISESQPA